MLLDGYFLGKPYGFGRFAFELCRALGRATSDFRFVVAVPARLDESQLPEYPNLRWHKMPDASFPVWEQILIPRLAHDLRCDLIHFLYNTRAIFTRGIRTVTTVHDVQFLSESVSLRDPKARIMSEYSKWVFRLGIRKSDALVSVSNTTQSVLAGVGLTATTVYNTVDGLIAQLPQQPTKPTTPFIVHRGGYLPHRNTERIITAFRKARPLLPKVTLKIVGAPEGAFRWNTRGDDSIEFLPRLTDAELAAVYARSSCVVAASLQEGFGLPIIEGFGFGSPVITSDLDPMREVAQDAALLVDPFDVASIANAMISVLSDTRLANSLVAKGHCRLVAFSSTRLAEEMLRVYATCLMHGPSGGRG